GVRELLESVLPLETLGAADRSRVERALLSGVTREIERAALSTIERLADGGALRRVPTPSNVPGIVLRFQPRDTLELITVHLPGPVSLPGVVAFPRSGLPTRVLARLDQLRLLLRLDDPTVVAESGAGRGRVLSQVAQAGRELLGDSTLLFHRH